MTNPMYCPMSFNRDAYFANGGKVNNPVECTPDCAWAVKNFDGFEGKVTGYGCAVAFIADAIPNTRPLEDDDE